MKRTYIIFIVVLLILFSTGAWLINAYESLKFIDILHFSVICLLVLFALLFGYARLKSARRGEPVEDELSKRIMMKASSISFFISIYLWLVLMYISDKTHYESDVIFGSGILGMAIIFAVAWIIIRWRGLRNE